MEKASLQVSAAILIYAITTAISKTKLEWIMQVTNTVKIILGRLGTIQTHLVIK